MARCEAWLGTPVNGASLAVFRICVGLVMALEAYTLCVPSASTFNQIPLHTFYTSPDIKYRIPYAAFEWLPMLPPFWIHVIVGILGLGGLCMALGFRPRAAAAAVFLSWGYLYAVESTRTYWMSYYYLELLVSFLLIWMPAGRRYSVDAWLARNKGLPDTVPYWTLVLLRGQLVVTYFYAGVAKVSRDWLIDGEPVRYFMSRARLIEESGASFSAAQLQMINRILHNEMLVYLISWVGAFFDLSVGFLLLFRRTRLFGMVLIVIFHCTNHFVLFKDIHWFPLVGLTTALIFLDPDWPERLGRWVKHPKVSKPDWGYLVGGGVLFPGVGAALGWSLPATKPASRDSAPAKLGKAVIPFVVLWLGWQAANPLRQYISSADTRFTWEGLSFCWRLKAEVYRCAPSKFFIQDSGVISQSGGVAEINWSQWKGDRLLYRQVIPAKIDWSRMPEVFVTSEPRVGERIFYNPYSGAASARSEKEAIQRIGEIWRDRYGHAPQGIRRTVSLPKVAEAFAAAQRSRGVNFKDDAELAAAFEKLLRGTEPTEMMVLLRRINPFGLEGSMVTTQPLLLIEDEAVLPAGATVAVARVDRAAWRGGADTLGPEGARAAAKSGDTLVLYLSEARLEEESSGVEAVIADSQDHLEKPPRIRWNCMTDLTMETRMHLSMQPFLVRRYAVHIAQLWEKKYGRKPGVQALTAVSLNGRPPQLLVDPEADLASVPVSLFAHNAWIKDLETPRVPKGGIRQKDAL